MELLNCCLSFGQELKVDWINQYTTAVGSCIIESKCIDSIGNIYYGGTFKGEANIKFGKDSVSLRSSYSNDTGATTDFFISKVDKNGNLVWIKKYGSIKDDGMSKIILDKSENLIVVGGLGETYDFDPDPNIVKNIYGNFILKLTSDGDFLNVYDIRFDYRSTLIIKDNIGDIVLTGVVTSEGPFDFDITDSIYTVENTLFQSFILKLNNDLRFKWVKLIGSVYSSPHFNQLSISNKNEIVISGGFSSTIDFDPSNKYYALGTFGNSAFILNLDINGEFLWAKSLSKNSSGSDCNSSYIDNSGNIYSVGWFNGEISLDNISLKSDLKLNVFISKLSSSGSLVWLKQLKSKGNGMTPPRIIGDNQSHLFVFGQVKSDEVCLVPDSNQYTYFKGSEFILFLDENGNFIKYDTISCISDFEITDAQIISNNLYINGYFSYSAVFNFDVNKPKLSASSNVGFIGKLNYCFTNRSQIDISSCNYYSWSLNGKTYNQSGIYWDTIKNKNGCDSIITLNLTIKKSSNSTLNKSECDSYLAPNGQILTQSGIYSITITNKVGCDSIITLNLLIRKSSFNTINPIVCDSYTALNGIKYYSSGIYSITIPNKAGCDSIITVNLTVNKKTYKTINQTSCDSYLGPNNTLYSKSGTYQIIIPNKKGCDSLITLNLIINTLSLKVNKDTSICEGNPIVLKVINTNSVNWDKGVINKKSFTPIKSDSYTAIGSDENGCFDTVSVNVNVFSAPKISVILPDTVICQNEQFTLKTLSENVIVYQWKLNGINIKKGIKNTLTSNLSGEYKIIVQSDNGCEVTSSPVTIELSPLPTIEAGNNQTICYGDSIQLRATNASNYQWSNGIQNGEYISPKDSDTYRVSTIDNFGCRNSDSLSVTVNLPTFFEFNISSLGGFNFNGNVYGTSGKYIQHFTNKAGCDSIITLNLIIEKLGLNEASLKDILVFPNPTKDGKIFIKTEEVILTLLLSDSEGRRLFETNSTDTIYVSNYSKGIYFLRIQTNSGFHTFKIIVD